MCEAISLTVTSHIWFIIACLHTVSRLGLSTGCYLPWKPASSPHLSVSMMRCYQFTSVPLRVHWGFLNSSQHQFFCLKESGFRHHTEIFGYTVLLLEVYGVILPLDLLYILLSIQRKTRNQIPCLTSAFRDKQKKPLGSAHLLWMTF